MSKPLAVIRGAFPTGGPSPEISRDALKGHGSMGSAVKCQEKSAGEGNVCLWRSVGVIMAELWAELSSTVKPCVSKFGEGQSCGQ